MREDIRRKVERRLADDAYRKRCMKAGICPDCGEDLGDCECPRVKKGKKK